MELWERHDRKSDRTHMHNWIASANDLGRLDSYSESPRIPHWFSSTRSLTTFGSHEEIKSQNQRHSPPPSPPHISQQDLYLHEYDHHSPRLPPHRQNDMPMDTRSHVTRSKGPKSTNHHRKDFIHSMHNLAITDNPDVSQRLKPLELDPRNIKFGKVLGKGQFGSVYKAQWKNKKGKKLDVAVKELLKDEDQVGNSTMSFFREVDIMVQMDHPCILSVIGICRVPDVSMVLELAPLGSIFSHVFDHGDRVKVSKDLPLWAGQVASGMRWLSLQGYVHRDLAARNIMLVSVKQAKIGDFGMARKISPDGIYYGGGGPFPLIWNGWEAMRDQKFSSASDVWGFGVFLWEMHTLCKSVPYKDVPTVKLLDHLLSGHRLSRPSRCPKNIYSLMCSCWEHDPNNRPSFKILRDYFVDELGMRKGSKTVERTSYGLKPH